jgi:glycosyltransferase involved in cell wall biosynthesis
VQGVARAGASALSWKGTLGAAVNRVLCPFDLELVRGADFWRPLSRLRTQTASEGLTEPFSPPFLRGFQGSRITSLQEPADFAVVIPTILRSTLVDTVQSVFNQRFSGRIQIVIGIDASKRDTTLVEQICGSIPDRQSVLLFYPGYSTSCRHGGVHISRNDGSLRTMLSYLANSRYVAYLDDDNWWSDDHLSTMHAQLSAGAEWAYALRWFVHPDSRQPICRDEWESVGPGRGYFRKWWGGWVDPNCLAINKIACEAVLRWWSVPMNTNMDSDRNVFRVLRTEFRGAPTGRYSVYYQINETDLMHPYRLSVIGEQRYRSSGEKHSRSALDGCSGRT